jgi:pimeloyl-ACP methyl ester carboxylesterase
MPGSAEDKYVRVGNINTRYRQAGEKGSTVVLVHGFPASLEAWEKNIDALARHHRVYAMDWPGNGRTDKTPLIKDLYELEPFFRGFMDTMHIDKASFIGNSMGGGISLLLTIRYPERVEKLVLVDSAGLGPEVSIFYRLVSIPLLGKLLAGKPSHQNIKKMVEAAFYNPSLVAPDMVDLYYEFYQLPGMQAASMSIARAGATLLGQRARYWKPVRRALGIIKAPALIFWGRQDKVIPVKHAQIAARIPGSRLYIYEKCGHAPMIEYPDKFNKAVLEFLAEE